MKKNKLSTASKIHKPINVDSNKGAFNLAVLRVFVTGYLLLMFDYEETLRLIELPLEARHYYGKAHLFFSQLSFTPGIVKGAALIFYCSLLLAMLGTKTRINLLLATLSSTYLLGIPHLFGHIHHQYHHLISFLWLLFCSPCSEYFSLDSKDKDTIRKLNYELYVKSFWILLSIFYFFPGLAKLQSLGLNLDWSNHLSLIIQNKLFNLEGIFTPAFSVHEYPALTKLGGCATIAFELLFGFAAFIPRLRTPFALSAIGFHIAVELTMGISFFPLWVSYIPLLDWHSILEYFKRPPTAKSVRMPENQYREHVWLVLAYMFLLAQLLAGLFSFNSWPLSVYPRFSTIPQKTTWRVQVELVSNGERILKPPFWGREKFGGETQQMKRYKKMLKKPAECRKVYKILTHRDPTISSTEEIRFIAKKRSVLVKDVTKDSLEEKLVCRVLKGKVFPTPISH